jgi:TetR/AcrR family transcriptional regulator, mexJK operon transcriptional repressor
MTDIKIMKMGRRGRPTAQDTIARQGQLLSVARRIFVERGYHSTTMEDVAAAAGITKKTLYAWHRDKETLFHQCVIHGAQRFPNLRPDGEGDVRNALVDYAVALHDELAREDSSGLGMLFMREGSEFPELAKFLQRPHQDYLIAPLASFLRKHGMEEEGRTERTALFINMALSPLHNKMMMGMQLPSPEGIRYHAEICADLFCGQAKSLQK